MNGPEDIPDVPVDISIRSYFPFLNLLHEPDRTPDLESIKERYRKRIQSGKRIADQRFDILFHDEIIGHGPKRNMSGTKNKPDLRPGGISSRHVGQQEAIPHRFGFTGIEMEIPGPRIRLNPLSIPDVIASKLFRICLGHPEIEGGIPGRRIYFYGNEFVGMVRP